MEKIFFDSWKSILRILFISISAYSFLIFFLRISGKRTLSKMNAFDFIITIALGSTLSSVIITKNIAFVDGLIAFALLILLQYIVTKLSVRYKRFSKFIKSEPSLLFYRGHFLRDVMNAERITESEIMAVVRENGFGSLEKVDAIVIETDGSLSVIEKIENSVTSVLSNVSKKGK